MEETDEMDLNDGLDMCESVERRSLSDATLSDIRSIASHVRAELRLARANLAGCVASVDYGGKEFYMSPEEYLPQSLELIEEQLRDCLQRVKALRSKIKDQGIA